MKNGMMILLSAGLAASAADASIVRTDFGIAVGPVFNNQGNPIDGTLDNFIDVNNDGVDDFNLQGSYDSSAFLDGFQGLAEIELIALGSNSIYIAREPGDPANVSLFDSLEAGDVVGDTLAPGLTTSSSASIFVAAGLNGDPDGFKDGLWADENPTVGGFGALGFGLDDGSGGFNYGALYFDANDFSGDLTEFEVTLDFTEFDNSGSAYTIVPAPSALAVLAMGGVAAGRRQRRSA